VVAHASSSKLILIHALVSLCGATELVFVIHMQQFFRRIVSISSQITEMKSAICQTVIRVTDLKTAFERNNYEIFAYDDPRFGS
jgi:hypothetical protein